MLKIEKSDRMIESTFEASKVVVNLVSKVAARGGLFGITDQLSSKNEIARRLKVHPSKIKTLDKMLKLLESNSFVTSQIINGKNVYKKNNTFTDQLSINEIGDLGRTRFDSVMKYWDGYSVKYNWLTNIGQILGDNLDFLRNGPEDKVPFGRTLLSSEGLDWRTILTEPVYELGRVKAVRELVSHGNRFLDLACGPGIGVQRIGEYSTNECEVIGVDLSNEMIQLARHLIYPNVKTKFIVRDLNMGLPLFQENYFDGILFMGAFHFIKNKKQCLIEMNRVLRPGGVLILGHNFAYTGMEDQSIWEFYFSLLKEELYPIDFNSLQTLVSETGFQEKSQYHRGSFTYIVALKPEALLKTKKTK